MSPLITFKSDFSSCFTLKPKITRLNSFFSDLASLISLLVILPIEARLIFTFLSFNKLVKASKVPKESALIIIPSISVSTKTSFTSF